MGLPSLDRALGGGLKLGALHEMRSAETRAVGAAHGFVTALITILARADPRPVLWVSDAQVLRETGRAYGPGLVQFGLDPARILLVGVNKPGEALWVFEEGLRCTGLAAAVAEILGNPALLDLTATRRLLLRARDSRVTGILLRQGGAEEPGAALTRFEISPRPAEDADFPAGIGPPAWRLTLERNRAGPTGTFDVEWNHAQRAFREPGARPALPVGPSAVPLDRPNRAAGQFATTRRAG